MKLTTRLGVGAALAVLPLVGVLAFAIERMQGLALSNERLTTRQLVGAQVASGVQRRLERLEEYHRKYAVSADPGYSAKLEETADAIEAELQSLSTARLTPDERDALAQLQVAWSDVARRAARPAVDPDPPVLEGLDEVLAAAAEVQRRSREAARAEAIVASELREQTRITALSVAGGAVALSLVLILLTVRSIRTRLDHFIVGTRAVSQGAFSFQLEAGASDELGQVARAFNRMTEALSELERLKADFLSSVSHELRTPLVAMQETNGVLLDEVAGPLTPSQRRMLTLNDQAVTRLSTMISDLLELSRLSTAPRYRWATRDLTELTLDAVEELQARARERGVALRPSIASTPTPALCDPDRYVQVVQNLVDNALKYTPRGGTVRVELGPLRDPDDVRVWSQYGAPEGEVAVLRVDDTGPGIPAEDRDAVFEKFFRRKGLPSTDGVGLGLAICREIVKTHRGWIWVAESEGGGASMRVAWPLSPARRRRNERIA